MKSFPLFLFSLFLCFSALSQPISSSRFNIGDNRFYLDSKDEHIVYFVPESIKIERSHNGIPKASLIKMRQVGDAVTKTEDRFHYRNLFQFAISLSFPDDIDENQIKSYVDKENITLQPLPLSEINIAVLIPRTDETSTDTINGSSETTDLQKQLIWSTKRITVELSNSETQLLEHALKSNNTIASFIYEVRAEMIEYGVEKTRKYEEKDSIRIEKSYMDTTLIQKTVIASSHALNIDLSQYPDLLIEADANGSLPPNYPILEVRNYEYSQVHKIPHVVKKIEFRAIGISGERIESQISFYSHSPEIYQRMLRFSYPVNLHKPLQYRIVTVYDNRRTEVSDWKTVDNWSAMIDITEM